MMVMLTVAEDQPPLLLPQIVNVLSAIKEVGVPQIVPLLVPNERPLGSAGLMAQEVIVPGPVSVAFSGKSVLDWPFVSVKFSGLYSNGPGACAFTPRLRTNDEEPPLLFA